MQGSTDVALTMGSESNNSLSNSKEVQTCFDLSKQKYKALLLVCCPALAAISSVVSSELKKKKVGQEVTRENSNVLAELGSPLLCTSGNLTLQMIMLSARQQRESSLQFSPFE